MRSEKIVILETDLETVAFEDSKTLKWEYVTDTFGDEIRVEHIPFHEAEDYFTSCGRDDIAELIRTRSSYRYGHTGQW